MRILINAAPALLLLVAAGCAPTTGTNSYTVALDRLSADCTARGGILAPSGRQTGRPEADYVCRITGGASRLNDDD